MRGLTIVVVTVEPARWDGALRLAAAQAALGARTRLFLDGAAVALLAAFEAAPAPGLPSRGELVDSALALGVELVVCQSGLAATGLDLTRFDPRIAGGGLVSLLATLGEDRLVAI